MSARRCAPGAALLLALALAACRRDADTPIADRPAAPPTRYALGHPADSGLLARLDVDIDPSGHGLPPGSGTAAQGGVVYAAKCASCHGAKGEGQAIYPRLVGRDPRDGFPFASDPKITKTVGNYWPYATTLFDYVHRAMPYNAPGSLKTDETYAVVAWLLAQNEIVPPDAVMDARALAEVRMPARDRFVNDNRHGGPGFR